jgi:hypothetical protein
MTDGIYTVSFSSSQGQLGTGGVVYLVNSRVYGGDANFYYTGTINQDSPAVTGQIHVGPHQEPAASIFGPLKEFDLNISGAFRDDTFGFEGAVVGHPEMRIKLAGKKVASL